MPCEEGEEGYVMAATVGQIHGTQDDRNSPRGEDGILTRESWCAVRDVGHRDFQQRQEGLECVCAKDGSEAVHGRIDEMALPRNAHWRHRSKTPVSKHLAAIVGGL